MILSIQGPFDLGAAVGVDDTPFTDSAKVRAFHDAIGLPVEVRYQSETPSTSNMSKVIMGTGVRVDLAKSALLEAWLKAAEDWAQLVLHDAYCDANEVAQHFPYLDFAEEDVRPIVEAAFLKSTVVQAYIDYYSVGCGFVRLDIEYKGELNYAAEYFGMFEDAWWTNDGLRELLHQQADAFLRAFRVKQKGVPLERKEIKTDNLATIKPALIMLAVCQKGDPEQDAIIDMIRSYEHETTFEILDLDEALVHLGYGSAAIAFDDGDEDDIYFPLQMSQVSSQIRDAFNEHFLGRSQQIVKISLIPKAHGPDTEELRQLRMLVTAVIQMTNLYAGTQYLTHWRLFGAFEKLNMMQTKLDNLTWALDAFTRVARDLEEAQSRKRERRITEFLVLLTALTTMGVMASALSAVDYDFVNVPSYLHRAEWLIVPTALIIASAWFVIRRK